jgi:hypothetical protein
MLPEAEARFEPNSHFLRDSRSFPKRITLAERRIAILLPTVHHRGVVPKPKKQKGARIMKTLFWLSLVVVLLALAPAVAAEGPPAACGGLTKALEHIPPDSPGYAKALEMALTINCAEALDHAALVALYINTDGDNDWKIKDGWEDLSTDHCGWYGVTCSGEGRVIWLDLHQNSNFPLEPYPWNRPIPSELGYLSELTILNLQAMYLTDSIPASLGDLVHLQTLNLQSNRLSGTIPAELTNMGSMTSLGAPMSVLFWVGENPSGNNNLCWETEEAAHWAIPRGIDGDGPAYYYGPTCPIPDPSLG